MLRNSTGRVESTFDARATPGKNAKTRASREPLTSARNDCSIVAVATRGSASVLGRALWSTKNGTLSRSSRSRFPDPRVSSRRHPVNRRRHDPSAVEALDFPSGGYIKDGAGLRDERGARGGAAAPPPDACDPGRSWRERATSGPPSSASSRSSPSPASACASPAGGTRSRPSGRARATGSCARSRR